MVKWIARSFRIAMLGVVCFLGYSAFLSYQKGYFSIPDLPEGAYAFSFRGGLRGIVLNAEVSNPVEDAPKFFRRLVIANPDRLYGNIEFNGPDWLQDAWTTCIAPSEQERLDYIEYQQTFSDEEQRDLAHSRLDAICVLDVDGEEVLRGLLFSVPKL